MNAIHAIREEILSTLAIMAMLALVAAGVYEIHQLRRSVAALTTDVAQLRADRAAHGDDQTTDDSDDDEQAADSDNDDATADVTDEPGDALYKRAQDAYVQGHYVAAIRLAENLEADQPQRAMRIIGAASCFLKDRAGAQRAYKTIDSTGREFLKYVCARNAVRLP